MTGPQRLGDETSTPLQQALAQAGGGRCCAPVLALPPTLRGSRRRRLWELDGHAHCPVVGVCLPLASARRLADKLLGRDAPADDYGVHRQLVTYSKQRTPVAEAVQKALDERHAQALRATAALKSRDGLHAWWRAHAPGDGLGAALWATLTHPLCDASLEHQILGEVHMRQHQVGHEQRADWTRLRTLTDEVATLREALAAARERAVRQGAELAELREHAQAQVMQLRGQLLARETRIDQLEQELAALHEQTPGLETRRALAAQLTELRERALNLQRALVQAQARAQHATESPALPDACPSRPEKATAEPAHAGDGAPSLPPKVRAVLCVGGRPGAVPAYRAVLERLGARFEHHDGGQEHSPHRLQASLAAADLVICQAGCVSHAAYWRVKDHCKRTGKRCVFVDSTGAGALERALQAVWGSDEAAVPGGPDGEANDGP
jgi:hypothetical protein